MERSTKLKLAAVQHLMGIEVTGELDEMTQAYFKGIITKYPELLQYRKYLFGGGIESLPNEDVLNIISSIETRSSWSEGEWMKAHQIVHKNFSEPENTIEEEDMEYHIDTDGMNNPATGFLNGIEKYFLSSNEYITTPVTDIKYFPLHHTAGWPDPYKQIDIWENDDRGRIGTELVVGGYGEHDGRVVQCMPLNMWAFDLGISKKHRFLETDSVSIEFCNFGQLTGNGNNMTWFGKRINNKDEIVVLKKEFRGHKAWHRYTDDQLNSTRRLLIALANRYSVDIRNTGMLKILRQGNIDKAFGFNPDFLNRKEFGVMSHSNVRTDKFDVSPQPNLISMLLSI